MERFLETVNRRLNILFSGELEIFLESLTVQGCSIRVGDEK